MEKLKVAFILCVGVLSVVHGFSSSDDKFVKKYAMMKIYESCFGPEVVKEIRKEMKAACLKCASLSNESPTIIIPAPQPNHQAGAPGVSAPGARPPMAGQQRPTQAEINNLPLHAGAENVKLHGNIDNELPENMHGSSPGFDAEKLHQAILAYRPSPFPPQAQFRPYTGGQPFFAGFNNPGPMFYPGNAAFTAAQPYSAFPQFSQPFYQPQYYNHLQRMSRDMNYRDQIDMLTNRMSGRVRNVTCVMQELGYLDENLEPNFEKIISRIANLPVQEELKRDMQDGVTFCQQFSQCIPETKRDKSPLSRELVKPMFFFKCYKHKKLEACIMKDVRERFNQDTDEDFEALSDGVRSDELRQFRSAKTLRSSHEDNLDEFSSAMYDFLYGSNNVELDSLF